MSQSYLQMAGAVRPFVRFYGQLPQVTVPILLLLLLVACRQDTSPIAGRSHATLLDKAPAILKVPWATTARMEALHSPKL
jgi:hypothetical protein